MQTEVLKVSAEAPETEVIERAARVLREGGLVAFPTETVYGLGANALDAAAVARIFAAKGRPAHNPLIVHVADQEQARQLAAEWPVAAARLAQRFWPGPLTLVVRRREGVPDNITAAGPTVAVRVPVHPVALALLKAAALPIAAPSANRSSKVSPTRAEHVLRGLKGRIDLLLDGGPTPGGIESTVVDVTVTPPRLLRPGPIAPSDLEAVVGPVSQPELPAAVARSGDLATTSGDLATTNLATTREALRSPGMLSRHYAPRAALELVAGPGRCRVEEMANRGFRVGWLTFEDEPAKESPQIKILRMPHDPAAYAALLYAALHELDDAGVDRIVADLPPPGQEWLAVHDRLRRASSP